MTVSTLVIEREIDLPPVIVWDAFVDPDLVGGWLGEAVIEARLGGRYDLAWVGAVDFPPAVGRIERMTPRELLGVSTDRHGDFLIELVQAPGGSRGSTTVVTVTVHVDTAAAFLERVRSNWATALIQLDDLLRGHPMEWTARASTDPDAPSQPRLA